MGGNPNFDLFKPRFEGLLNCANRLPILRIVVNIETDTDQLVVIQGTLIKPSSMHDDGVGARHAKALNELIVCFKEFFLLNRTTVIVKQREQDFESDHGLPLLQRPMHVDSRCVGPQVSGVPRWVFDKVRQGNCLCGRELSIHKNRGRDLPPSKIE